ncbi:MAG: CPBP family intramembrane metalloprotease, partial [Ruminococcus sp.]|nr:CPBP family intramembrane metalloprotease [Ruminococcus sp.]
SLLLVLAAPNSSFISASFICLSIFLLYHIFLLLATVRCCHEKIKGVFGSEAVAVIGSSILFGLFHILGGDIGQMLVTGFLGILFCLCRKKIKDCSTLSLIIMHGIYDALITVWANCLL